MERWDNPEYDQITRALATADGRMTVQFGDGSTVAIDGNRLLPETARDAHWGELTVDEFGDFVVVPSADGDIDIPADRIRVLTDPQFARHRAELARRQAQRIGERIRTLRRIRGLNANDVASRAGIAATSMSRIELGQHDVVLTTLARILEVMGCSWDDLEEPDSVKQSAG